MIEPGNTRIRNFESRNVVVTHVSLFYLFIYGAFDHFAICSNLGASTSLKINPTRYFLPILSLPVPEVVAGLELSTLR